MGIFFKKGSGAICKRGAGHFGKADSTETYERKSRARFSHQKEFQFQFMIPPPRATGPQAKAAANFAGPTSSRVPGISRCAATETPRAAPM